MNFNSVHVAGNLVRAPELRYTPQGTPVANASIGVNDNYIVNGEKRNEVTFVDVQIWGAAAENFSKLAQKGQQIFVDGALRQDVWKDKEGQNRSKLFVRADSWQFTQYKASEEQREAARQAQEVTR